MIRVYICPIIGTGVKGNPYKSKGATFGYQYSNYIPSNPATGVPTSPWSLAVLKSNDWTAIEADPTCDDLFGGDLPANIDTNEELRALLKNRTVSDVPLARRNAIIAVLDKYGVDRSDFTGSTPLWRVFQRVMRDLFGANVNEINIDF